MRATILIVDDDADHARMVQTTLESSRYQTAVATDGIAALEQIKTSVPDLMILDIAMPELDGWQVLQQLRGNAATAHLPVILLTAKTEADDIAMSWHTGADLYLKKPFSAPALLSFVERLLGDPRPHSARRN